MTNTPRTRVAPAPMAPANVPLSILDLAVVGVGSDPATALRETADLARLADAWGYRRFWVAEHHSTLASATPSPAVLISRLAGITRNIRLGSGGVMLTNHAPLVVAEEFGVLNTFFPGRLDLGIGRSPGALPAIGQALGRSAGDDDPQTFPQRVSDLLGFLGRGFPEDHPYARSHVFAAPPATDVPVWMLGSSKNGAQVAARFGLPFVAAFHINAAQAAPAVDLYREEFRPSEALSEPYVIASVTAVCADTHEAATTIARPGALGRLLLSRGEQTSIPTPEAAEHFDYTPGDREFVNNLLDNAVIGTPAVVRSRLEELRKTTGVDEIMLTSMIHDFADRSRSFELIAHEFELSSSARSTR